VRLWFQRRAEQYHGNYAIDDKYRIYSFITFKFLHGHRYIFTKKIEWRRHELWVGGRLSWLNEDSECVRKQNTDFGRCGKCISPVLWWWTRRSLHCRPSSSTNMSILPTRKAWRNILSSFEANDGSTHCSFASALPALGNMRCCRRYVWFCITNSHITWSTTVSNSSNTVQWEPWSDFGGRVNLPANHPRPHEVVPWSLSAPSRVEACRFTLLFISRTPRIERRKLLYPKVQWVSDVRPRIWSRVWRYVFASLHPMLDVLQHLPSYIIWSTKDVLDWSLLLHYWSEQNRARIGLVAIPLPGTHAESPQYQHALNRNTVYITSSLMLSWMRWHWHRNEITVKMSRDTNSPSVSNLVILQSAS